MVNHFRTYLLNVAKDGNSLLTAGEEFISSSYTPRRQDALLNYVHTALFGGSPDREFVNLRGRQLLELVHASGLQDDITRYDSRITYLPWKPVFPTASSQKITIQKLTAGTFPQLITTGNAALKSNSNRARTRWQLQYVFVGSDSFEFQVVRQTAPAKVYPTETYALVGAAVHTPPIPLPDTPLKLTITDNEKTIGQEHKWNLEILELPQLDVSQVMHQLYSNSADYISALFPADGTDLQRKLLNVMLADRSIVNKYAAILLGIAEYTSLQPQVT